jgi:dTDP-4-dehydrorhamnose reductase
MLAGVRIVVLGPSGQLGRELMRLLPGATALARARADLRDPRGAAAAVAALGPDVVVNAAADNRVDAAEDDPGPCVTVNALAVAALAAACRATGAFLLHVSTDYVFDGRAGRPYTEEDTPNPLGVYARAKYAGELLARALAPRQAVVRVAALYGPGGSPAKGGSFVDRVLARARAGERLRVVADQVTSPTWAPDAAAALVRLLPRLVAGDAPGGLYHVANAGACSWHGLACRALALAGLGAEVEPIASPAPGARAPRPACSALATVRLAEIGEPPLRPWEEALAAHLAAG